MWDFGTLPYLDFSYLNTPEFQKAVQEAVATYTGVPVETATPVAAPQYVEPAVQYAAPIVAPQYVEPVAAPQPIIPAEIAQYIEPIVAPQVAAPAVAPVTTPAVVPQAVAAEPAAFVPSVLDTAGAALGNDPAFDAQALLDAGLSQADVNALANWSPSMISSDIIQPGGLGPASVDQNTYGFESLSAPLSNKGNPTAIYGNITNTIAVGPEQAVRLVDADGNVVFSGAGIEGATKAVEMAQGLSDQLGNKAAWEIQTGPSGIPGTSTDQWNTIAQENKNQSVIGAVGDVLGDAALGALIGGPIGAAIAAGGSIAGVNVSDIAYPILGAMTPLGPIAGAAAGSAVSGAVQGRPIEDILTQAAITAGTAGLMKGTPIGKSISSGIGNALSDIGFDPLVDNIVQAVSSGAIPQAVGDEIIVNAITNQLGSSVASGVVGAGIGSGLGSVVTPPAAINPPPAIEQLPETVVTAQPVDVSAGIGGIGLAPTVTPAPATPPATVEAAPIEQLPETIVTAQPVDVSAGIGGIGLVPTVTPTPVAPEPVAPPAAVEPAPTEQPADIIVTAQPVNVTTGIGGVVPVGDAVKPTPENPFPENVLVEQTPQKPADVTAGIGDLITPEPTPDEIIVTAQQPLPTAPPGLVDSILSNAAQTALPEVGPIDKAKTPMTTADYIKAILNGAGLLSEVFGGGGGGGGATLGPDGTAISYNPLNRQQRLRTPAGAGLGSYGFDPFTYGQASGDQPGEYLFFQTMPAAAPVTPAFTVPSGALQFAEGGDVDDDMVKHLIEYRKGGGHNGPGKVKGIGSGQEDKIPAWLSDGEYVWSAQDVADLGDGSTDEGVRRLDKMRQMVRHRAGRKDVKKIAKPQKGIDALLAAVGGK